MAVAKKAAVTKPAKPVAKKPTVVKPKPATKAAEAQLLALKVICREIDIDPRAARRLLRGKMDRPNGRWEFEVSKKESIVKLLKGETVS